MESDWMTDINKRLQHLTPEKRALLLAKLAKKTRESAPKTDIARRSDPGSYPLSFAQQRLWFFDQLEPNSALYNISGAVRLRGLLDREILERSLNQVLQRHEALRASFVTEAGEPKQIVASDVQITIPMTDLRHLPWEQREAEAMRIATEDAQRPFNLAQGPLLRASLLQTDEQEFIVVLSMHHIVSDGWSVGVLLYEMATLYDAILHQRPSPLPDLPIQYADFAAWQRAWLSGEVLERQLAYWRETLSDSQTLLDLPTDRPRPAVQTANGANLTFTLPPDLSEKLQAFSRREGATLFMILLASFQALLYRYTGQDDINIGSPIANRTHSEVEHLIGFFLNTLVLRTDLSGEPSFRELVKRVREVVLGAFAHQDLPFEMLVETLQPERALSHSPLFQVGFTLQTASDEAAELPNLTLQPVVIDSGSAKYDITLLMAAGPDGLAGNFEYNTDLFDRSTIERMAGHLITLLQGVMAEPGMTIDQAPLLTEEEQQQLLVTWNDTAMPTPSDRCIHELFERQVVLRPQAIAVTFEGHALTYEQLNRKANQLAHHLRKLGMGPETLVAIATERSLETVVGILGTLKAGGAFLPIDPTYPQDRIAFMFMDSGAPILLTQAALVNILPENGAQIIRLDEDWPQIALEPETNPDLAVRSENTAYVIYTSGSTGRPKGAALRHGGLCNLAEVQHQAFAIHEGSRILQFAPLSFDASVWETAMALANGGTLCLARQSVLSSGPELLRLLREERITTVTLPPSVLTVLSSQELPDLQVIVAAGEKCTAEIVQEWAPGRRFFDAYGPTETTVCASMHLCSPDDPQDPPIGRPISNCRLYVVDSNLQIVPVGVPGELVVGGVNVGRGYLNRPELTDEKFIPDPFGGPDDKLYRTGDLVRYRADGAIEFLGRIDHQVKIRGFRIELGEIESLLRRHDEVLDTVVVAHAFGEQRDKRLVAYLLIQDDASLEPSTLRAYLQQHLPEYMTPSHFVFLHEFPLSPAGKVDRKALPAPDSDRSTVATAYLAPRNETEKILVAISEELLAVDKVGVNDNFFELGGHSLLATQFISRVREAFDVEVELRTLFERPTVALIAEDIDVLRQEKAQQTDAISDLLAQLDQLSDEQALAMLQQAEERD